LSPLLKHHRLSFDAHAFSSCYHIDQGLYLSESIMTDLHLVREKRDRQYFGYNFNKFQYIIVIFCNEYHEGNAKLLSNQYRYFTFRIRQLSGIVKHEVITDNCS